MKKLKVAIVYDRVNKFGGAERVLIALHKMFPSAPLYTSVYDLENASWASVFPKIETSFLQNIPFAKTNHEFLAPLMPLAFGLFDFSDFDLVISVTSEAAKGIKVFGKTVHVCYCLTPTRYLWSGYNEYFKDQIFKGVAAPIVSILRIWDKMAAKRPDKMIAISSEVQKRIKKYYHRNSEIVFPPVQLSMNRFTNVKKTKEYYLLVSRLDYGYKKVDLAIEAFNKLDLPLVIVGTGRLVKRLKNIAGKNIKFVGKVTDRELTKYYQGAKALIMPQEEDFGIVSIEAQSFGAPVITFGKGGSHDTVIDGKTGIYFKKQTVGSLLDALYRFEKTKFKVDNLRNNANKFSEAQFSKNFARIIKDATGK